VPRTSSTHVDDPAAVGERLRSARTRLGLTQRELAFPGCSAAYISRIESGERVPSLQVLRELGRQLDVSAEYLATGARVVVSEVDEGLVEAELAIARGELELAAERYADAHRTAMDVASRVKARAGEGRVRFLRGNHDDAIELLEEVVAHPALSVVERTAVADALGRAYVSCNRFEDALALFKREHAEAKRAGDGFELMRFSVLLANTYVDCGEFARARDVLSDILDAAREAADPIARAHLYWSQARLYSSEGDPSRAARYARLALATLETTEHTNQIARALVLLAHLENDRGNPTEALALYEKGREAVAATGNHYEEGMFLLEKARAQAALGEFELAGATALGSIPLLQHGSRTNLGRAYAVAAEIFKTLGDEVKALELYELAAELLDAGDRHLVAVYRSMAGIMEGQGRTDEALELLKRALDRRAPVRREA
jgi:tetratricopeptide (TPR) repeat protein